MFNYLKNYSKAFVVVVFKIRQKEFIGIRNNHKI